MGFVWAVMMVCAVLLGIAAFLVAPGHMSPEAKKMAGFFVGLNCAHRGLYQKDQSIPENSLAAFAAAQRAGYGVELDVQLSRDGQVVVFHDDSLKRACGVETQVDELDFSLLKTLSLFGTEERIPLLTQALEVLGDTPVIVELKTAGRQNAVLCQMVLEILRSQGKAWCVESFDPRVVRWFRRNAPEALRGQLSNRPGNFENLSAPFAFALGNLLTNAVARPHFIAYGTNPQSLCVRLCRAMRPMTVVWTVRNEKDQERFEQENDTVIFEYYLPAPGLRRRDRFAC